MFQAPPPQREVPPPKKLKTEPEEPDASGDRRACTRHRKPRKLFCLNCWEPMCGDCFSSDERHARHHIDNLSALYHDKRQETDKKLDVASNAIDVLQEKATLCDKNLSIVDARNKSVLWEIERVYAQAKEDVQQMTTAKTSKIQPLKGSVAEKQQQLLALRGTVRQLHPEDFVKQCSEINRQCETLMLANSTSEDFVPAATADIGCDLIPPFDMVAYKLLNFNDKAFWPQTFTSKHSGLVWCVDVTKGEKITVKVYPRNSLAVNNMYEALVILPHQDYSKEVHKTFAVCVEEVILPTAQCVQQGFISGQNELTIQVGVRPFNALIEKGILERQYRKLETKYNKLKTESQSLKNNVDLNVCFMCFEVLMMKLNAGEHYSSDLTDNSGRLWCMYVKPSESNTDVEAYVMLREGSPANCNFFIELLHNTDVQKHIRRRSIHRFDTNGEKSAGWRQFVSKQVLKEKAGYRLRGRLRFIFGVQPIDS